ncbi:MAG TPA: gamma-glutamyltransferase [Gammaproteobacteria bacterium]|nr:gamma-glutamyltransferase [Gammaproteobacteria bacterium]
MRRWLSTPKITGTIAQLFLFFALVHASFASTAQEQAIFSRKDIFHPVFAVNGMVATQEARATRIGVEVLEDGGNAVDAAVAVGFALAVTLPRAGNLGGGGFMLVHEAGSGKTHALDYREMAPASSTRNMFLDQKEEVDENKSRFSRYAAGVPGTVAGLVLALEAFGSLSLDRVITPAIRLAQEGIDVSPDLAASLEAGKERLMADKAAARIFFRPEGVPYRAGDRLVQSDLAWSLKQIAAEGAGAFYRGAIAERIVEDMRKNGGPITAADLAGYRPVLRAPVEGSYRGYEIRSMPPPSSGGVHLVQILNILEGFPIAFLGHNSADTIHLMAESMKLAYADRSMHLGDPDFWKVPAGGLTSKGYAAELRQGIRLDRARPSNTIGPGNPLPFESSETTHFSVMDRAGNAVSNTYTINFSFGSGIVAEGTGILLNNEMDDFSAKPGVPNAYGLIGGKANAIDPGKRPLSSMTPTIVLKEGRPFLATGSPGGSRIITTTLQVILNVIDHDMNIAEATAAPRVHHQWLPDELRVEPGLSVDTLDLLMARGHEIAERNAMGSTQSVMRIEGGFLGAADPRRPGALAAGQ